MMVLVCLPPTFALMINNLWSFGYIKSIVNHITATFVFVPFELIVLKMMKLLSLLVIFQNLLTDSRVTNPYNSPFEVSRCFVLGQPAL
jgi:hypothetical protein